MIEPERIMFLGDTHGNAGWTRQAIDYAAGNGCDVIVQVGDFGFWSDNADTAAFLAITQSRLAKHGITLYWVDGNHEDHDRLAARPTMQKPHRHRGPWSLPDSPNIIHLPRGYRWHWWGQAWMSLGGAASVDRLARKPGKSWWPGETLTDEDVEFASRPGNVDVIVAHDAPYGVDIPKIGIGEPNTDSGWPFATLLESSEHRRKVRQVVDAVRPRLYVHGHYHLRYQAYYRLPGGGRTLVQGLDCDGTPAHLSTMFLNRSTHEEMDS